MLVYIPKFEKRFICLLSKIKLEQLLHIYVCPSVKDKELNTWMAE